MTPVPQDLFLDDVNGLRIHYLDWGNPTAPTMLLVHGFSSSAHGWDEVAPAFADRYHVVAVDHRGHGESDWDPQAEYRLGVYARDLEEVVDRLGLQTFVLIGHSMGGAVALVYTAAHPNLVEALVLEDSGARRPRTAADLARPDGYAARPLFFADRAEAEAYLRPTLPTVFEGRAITYGLRELPDGRVTWRADVRGLAQSRQTIDPVAGGGLWEQVEALQCPTLVMRAGDSAVFPRDIFEEMPARNARIRGVEIPDTGHWLHYDNPSAFVETVLGFLAE